jgi:excisionase family DNA binding protein
MSQNQSEYVTTTEAIQMLDVSKGKMAKLIRTGQIPYTSDPRNERAKLIKRSDIEAWLAKAVRPKIPHQRHIPTVIFKAPRELSKGQSESSMNNPPGPIDDEE